MMKIEMTLNGKKVQREISADLLLIDFLRDEGCYSVKRGCETSGCGLCTVFLDDKPVLSCSVLAARAHGHSVTTLEGLQEEAAQFGAFVADNGAEQCGFCNPGMIMNAIAMLREYSHPTDEQIREYLAGNLCRCSGYEGQLRAVKAFIKYSEENFAKAKAEAEEAEAEEAEPVEAVPVESVPVESVPVESEHREGE